MDILCFIWKFCVEQTVNWGGLFSSETRHVLQRWAFYSPKHFLCWWEKQRERKRERTQNREITDTQPPSSVVLHFYFSYMSIAFQERLSKKQENLYPITRLLSCPCFPVAHDRASLTLSRWLMTSNLPLTLLMSGQLVTQVDKKQPQVQVYGIQNQPRDSASAVWVTAVCVCVRDEAGACL